MSWQTATRLGITSAIDKVLRTDTRGKPWDCGIRRFGSVGFGKSEFPPRRPRRRHCGC